MQLVGGVDNLPNDEQATYFQTGDWHGECFFDGVGSRCQDSNSCFCHVDVLSLRTRNSAAVNVRFKADVHLGCV